MFTRLALRGNSATIVWGYRTAAVLRAWRISKQKGQWVLTATVERADAFQSRQKPLMFTAPRAKGFWAWPVLSLTITGGSLIGQLGKPEQ